ncbi:MAG: ABC transporter substrate-binding protein [Candidatus Brocadiia bacterium]
MRRYTKHVVVGILVIVAFSAFLLALRAGEENKEKEKKKEMKSPEEIVKDTTEEVLNVLRDPELKKEKKTEERRQKVREAVEDVFDWRAIAQRALARHWRPRTEEERKEFVSLFQSLVEKTYLRRIEEHADAEIVYEGQEVEDGYASVNAVGKAKDGTEVPIVYRLHQATKDKDEEEAAEWLIYDVKVEGVSLINNYRSQFNDIIVGGSYKKLIKLLKKKVKK